MADDGGIRRAARHDGDPAMLRAVGRLLIAMADEQIHLPPPDPEPGPAREPVPPPIAPRPPDDVELLLAEARQRAHRVIEDSVVRANELLRHEGGRGDWRLLERMRRSVNELGQEVHDLQDRLRRIEELLLAQVAYPPAQAPSTAEEPAPTPPSPEEPAVAEAPPPPAQGVEPAPAQDEPEPPIEEAEEIEAAVVEVAEHAAEAPSEPVESPAAAGGESAPEQAIEAAPAAVAVATAETETQHGASAAREVRFTPEQGSVVLRVAPVAGFHGLMRVQDALAEIAGVREAGVEAYAQGEARLRVRLADPIEAGRLADALGDHLGVPTQVLAASAEDRSVRLRFD